MNLISGCMFSINNPTTKVTKPEGFLGGRPVDSQRRKTFRETERKPPHELLKISSLAPNLLASNPSAGSIPIRVIIRREDGPTTVRAGGLRLTLRRRDGPVVSLPLHFPDLNVFESGDSEGKWL